MAQQIAELCSKCRKFKRAWECKYDRHHNILCDDCAEKLEWCSICGASLYRDSTPDGEVMHFDGDCFDDD